MILKIKLYLNNNFNKLDFIILIANLVELFVTDNYKNILFNKDSAAGTFISCLKFLRLIRLLYKFKIFKPLDIMI